MFQHVSPTALIVDDELLIRWSLAQGLQQIGFRILEASDGAEARRLFHAEFSVVLMDYKLPDTTGIDLIRELRSIAPDMPIILMTAYRAPNVEAQAAQLGVVQIVDKPFRLDDFVALVRAAVTTG